MVTVFLGTYTPRLDDKGRLALPAKFRSELAGGLVICKGQDRCLYVYAEGEFAQRTAAVRNAPVTNARARSYARVLFASATNDTPDGQGRIVISAGLRDYAGLTKDCTVIGADDRVEIWDSVAWQTYLDNAEPDFSDIADEVMPGAF